MDDFQVSRVPGSRRPPCDNLLDVFQNTCQDEAETMQACQDYAECGKRVVSPHLKHVLSMDMEEKRQLWQSWSDEVNEDGKKNRTRVILIPVTFANDTLDRQVKLRLPTQ